MHADAELCDSFSRSAFFAIPLGKSLSTGVIEKQTMLWPLKTKVSMIRNAARTRVTTISLLPMHANEKRGASGRTVQASQACFLFRQRVGKSGVVSDF